MLFLKMREGERGLSEMKLEKVGVENVDEVVLEPMRSGKNTFKEKLVLVFHFQCIDLIRPVDLFMNWKNQGLQNILILYVL